MKTIKNLIGEVSFTVVILPLIVVFVVFCCIAAGFIVGYTIRLSSDTTMFIAGLVTGSFLTVFGIVFSMQWLTAKEEQRHKKIMEHLNEEVVMSKTVRRSWFSNMVWKVGEDER